MLVGTDSIFRFDLCQHILLFNIIFYDLIWWFRGVWLCCWGRWERSSKEVCSWWPQWLGFIQWKCVWAKGVTQIFSSLMKMYYFLCMTTVSIKNNFFSSKWEYTPLALSAILELHVSERTSSHKQSMNVVSFSKR